jgi:hypothetical protein
MPMALVPSTNFFRRGNCGARLYASATRLSMCGLSTHIEKVLLSLSQVVYAIDRVSWLHSAPETMLDVLDFIAER